MKSTNSLFRILLTIALISLLIYSWKVVRQTDKMGEINPKYEEAVENYKEEMDKYRQKMAKKEQPNFDKQYGTQNISADHFEGPEVSVHAIEFWNKAYQKGDKGMLDHALLSAAFDPDHLQLGMPDVEVKVSPVKLYQPGREKLSKKLASFFNRNASDPSRPYKIYRKDITPDADTSKKSLMAEMQLWLMEFELAITARSDRNNKGSVNLTKTDKELKKYPGFWYGQSASKRLTADELKAEKDSRYGNLKVWLKLRPDNSPWYINNPVGKAQKAEMAIGAVYCMDLINATKKQHNLVHTSVGMGDALALYRQPEFGNNRDLGTNANISYDFEKKWRKPNGSLNDTTAGNIWNEEFFVKIYLKNFGSWREGLFGSKSYDDQLKYTFLMPILVEGTWDMQPPFELIPEWKPPKPFQRKGINLIPDWGMGAMGKVLTWGMLIIVAFCVLSIFFPGIIILIIGLFRRR